MKKIILILSLLVSSAVVKAQSVNYVIPFNASALYFKPINLTAGSSADSVIVRLSSGWLGRAKIKSPTTYSGSTNASGIYAVTFPTAYSATPNVQVNLISGTNKETWVVTKSTTGFSILVQSRVDVIGILPSYNNVSGRAVDVLVTEA